MPRQRSSHPETPTTPATAEAPTQRPPDNATAPLFGGMQPAAAPTAAPPTAVVPIPQPAAIVTRTPSAPMAFTPPLGLEGVTTEDLIIPRLKVNQPTTKEGTPGRLKDTISGEEFEKLEGIVILKVAHGRRYFENPGDKAPKCASDDRVRPAARIQTPVSAVCAGCPMSQWWSENGKRRPPKCAETINMLVVHQGMPYWMAWHGSSLSYVRKLLTAITLQASKNRKPAFGYAFDVALEKRTFPAGVAYMPKFEKLLPIASAETVDHYKSMHETFGHLEPAPMFDAEAERDETPEDPAAPPGSAFPFGANDKK